jgi:hypothetical protein
MGTEGLFDSFFETIEEMIRGQMGAQAQGQQQQPEAQQTNETCKFTLSQKSNDLR